MHDDVWKRTVFLQLCRTPHNYTARPVREEGGELMVCGPLVSPVSRMRTSRTRIHGREQSGSTCHPLHRGHSSLRFSPDPGSKEAYNSIRPTISTTQVRRLRPPGLEACFPIVGSAHHAHPMTTRATAQQRPWCASDAPAIRPRACAACARAFYFARSLLARCSHVGCCCSHHCTVPRCAAQIRAAEAADAADAL